MESSLVIVFYVACVAVLGVLALCRARVLEGALVMRDMRALLFYTLGGAACGMLARHGNGAAAAVALACAVVSARTDAQCGYIFDVVTLPSAIAVVCIALVEGNLSTALFGASVAGGSLALLHVFSGGRGMGLGDVKLALVLGGAFGPLVGLLALAVAFVVGALTAIALLFTRRVHRGDSVRFGPFLAAGAIAASVAQGW